MAQNLVRFEKDDDDFLKLLSAEAKKGKQGWIFCNIHPAFLNLMQKIEEIGHGELQVVIRDGLPVDGKERRIVRF